MRSKPYGRRSRSQRGAPVDSNVQFDPFAPFAPGPDDPSTGMIAELLFGDPLSDGDDGRPGRDTKLEQLCAQVADALVLALASARNAVLRDLTVTGVTPRRGAACLEVHLEVDPDRDPAEAEDAVQRALGWLRTEVGDAIARKRVPELVAVVLPADLAAPHDEEDAP